MCLKVMAPAVEQLPGLVEVTLAGMPPVGLTSTEWTPEPGDTLRLHRL